MTPFLGLLLSALGPIALQYAKPLFSKIHLPPAFTPLVHAGAQFGGAWVASKIGFNPFEAVAGGAVDLGAAAQLALTTTAVGNVGYEIWKRAK